MGSEMCIRDSTIGLSMPLLRTMEQVTVVTVEGWSVPGPSGDSLASHLRRNGIATELTHTTLDGRTPGHAILDTATTVGSSLVVKGAYTHSRLRQLVFGGATRHILYESTLPVLMAH